MDTLRFCGVYNDDEMQVNVSAKTDYQVTFNPVV